jgi:curved DNA-binding protein
VLSNPTGKRKYDRIWTRNSIQAKQKKYKEENKKENMTTFGEFFNMFFGTVDNVKEKTINKIEKSPIKGKNIETTIDVEIEEVFYGLDKKISLKTQDGSTKILTVSIPAGINDGEKIRLIGQGQSGINGGKSGDLFIKVNIKDSDKFKLKGNDLYTNLYLTPWEAALGTRTTIYSIDEGTSVYIPKGIESGEVLKVAGKGYKNNQGNRGDLIAKVNIVVPKELSQEEKKLFEKLSTISNFNPRKT